MFFGAGGASSIVTPAPLYPILPDFESVRGAAPVTQTPAAAPVAPEPAEPEPAEPEPVVVELRPRTALDHVDLSGKGSPGPGMTGTLISFLAVISASECTFTYGTSGASDWCGDCHVGSFQAARSSLKVCSTDDEEELALAFGTWSCGRKPRSFACSMGVRVRAHRFCDAALEALPADATSEAAHGAATTEDDG